MNTRFYNLPHYVYLLRGEGTNFFKIGLSRDVKRRAAAIQVPFDLVVVKSFQTLNRYIAQTVEQGLHNLYRDRRIRGEWFRDVDIDHFIDDAEYLAAGLDETAQRNYQQRHLVKKSVVKADTVQQDKIVLETLKSKGIEAALKVRERSLKS